MPPPPYNSDDSHGVTPTPASVPAPKTAARTSNLNMAAAVPASAPAGAKFTRDPAISVSEIHTQDNRTTFAPGESVQLWIDDPSDFDSWTTTDGQSGQEADATLYGKWSQGGLHYSTTSGYSTVWTAPDRVGEYKPKISVNDSASYGTTNGRNDLLVERTVTLTVARPRVWDVGTPIDKGTFSSVVTGGTAPTPTPTPNSLPGATPTATPTASPTVAATPSPTVTPTPTPTPSSTPIPGLIKILVLPGASATLTIDGAADQDHWTRGAESGDEADELTYTWSGAESTTATATVIAPQSGGATVTCTIDDAPTAVTLPDTGARDDASALVQVRLVVDADQNGVGDEDEATPMPTPSPTGTPIVTPAPTVTPTITPTPTTQPPITLPGQSELYWRVLRPADINNGTAPSLDGTIGGQVAVQVIVKVAKKGRVAPEVNDVTLRIQEQPDTDNPTVTHPFEKDHAEFKLDLNDPHWDFWTSQEADGGNPPAPVLVRTNRDSAKGENLSDDLNYFYTKTILWNTTSELTTDLDGNGPRPASTLLGQNGKHKISLVEVNGQPGNSVRFQQKPPGEGWQDADFNAQTTENKVGNLVLTQVSTSSGTEDYFKFDAASTDTSLSTPEINFTLKDEGDPHFYRWRVRVRNTNSEELDDTVVYEGISPPGAVNVKVNDATLAAEGSPQASITKQGTYNFEIRVFEYETEQAAQADIHQSQLQGVVVDAGKIDVMNLRSNYLYIPYYMEPPYQTSRGHEGRIVGDRNDASHNWLMTHYFKDDTRQTQPLPFKVTILDPALTQLGEPVDLEYNRNSPYFNRNVYHFAIQGFQENRYYIAVTTAKDDHQADYRDHKARSILAKNDRNSTKAPEVKFEGDKRAAAGGNYTLAGVRKQRSDDAHVATIRASFKTENPDNPLQKIPLSNQNVQFRFKENEGDDPAQFVTMGTGNTGAQITVYSSDPIETTTDAQGIATIRVLSNRQVGSAKISAWAKVEVPPAQGAAAVPLEWTEIIPDTHTVNFAKPEGKRLFGRIDRFVSDDSRSFGLNNRFWLDDFIYDQDKGWNFEPLALQRVGNPDANDSLIKCQFFLRFRKDDDVSKIDRNYFAFLQGTPTTTNKVAAVPPLATLDANGDTTIDEAEWNRVVLRATEVAPLENSLPDAAGNSSKLWFAVPEHNLRFSIDAIPQTDSMMIDPLPAPDTRAVAFCDKDGNYLQINGIGDPQTDASGKPIFGPNRPSAMPNFMPIETDTSGMATFYLRGGFLSHRMNEIKLSAKDTTTQ